MINIIPTTSTLMDLTHYFEVMRKVYNRSPDIENPNSQLFFVNELEELNISLKHINYGFMVTGMEHLYLSMGEYDFIISSLPSKSYIKGALITGSLHEWLRFITDNSNEETELPQRYLANLLHQYFESQGLHKLFHGMSKCKYRDGTYLLSCNKA